MTRGLVTPEDENRLCFHGKPHALRPGKLIRQQRRHWQTEDYGWEGGNLGARKGLFKWCLEGINRIGAEHVFLYCVFHSRVHT